jgi:hypothetical protein
MSLWAYGCRTWSEPPLRSRQYIHTYIHTHTHPHTRTHTHTHTIHTYIHTYTHTHPHIHTHTHIYIYHVFVKNEGIAHTTSPDRQKLMSLSIWGRATVEYECPTWSMNAIRNRRVWMPKHTKITRRTKQNLFKQKVVEHSKSAVYSRQNTSMRNGNSHQKEVYFFEMNVKNLWTIEQSVSSAVKFVGLIAT